MIYFLRNPRTGHIKIGCTNLIDGRLVAHVLSHGILEILGFMDGGRDTEMQLHHGFAASRVEVRSEREWYAPHHDLLIYIAFNADRYVSENLHSIAATPRKPVASDFQPALLRALNQKEIRDNQRYNQVEICKGAGISPGSFIRMKRGELHEVSARTIRKICDWLGVKVDELYEVREPA